MKTIITYIILTFSLLYSCSIEQNITISNPEIHLSQSEIKNGDEITIYITFGEETNIKYQKAVYSFDDKEIGTVTESPYTLQYKIEGESIGPHIISCTLSYKSTSITSSQAATTSLSKTIFVK